MSDTEACTAAERRRTTEPRQSTEPRQPAARADGRCATCGEPTPCGHRKEFTNEPVRRTGLPRRVPDEAPSIAAASFRGN
jgi:hypothetical protein